MSETEKVSSGDDNPYKVRSQAPSDRPRYGKVAPTYLSPAEIVQISDNLRNITVTPGDTVIG